MREKYAEAHQPLVQKATNWFTRLFQRKAKPQTQEPHLAIDVILDKIANQGMDSLSAREKLVLTNASVELKQKSSNKD
jgi:hypothetical protein